MPTEQPRLIFGMSEREYNYQASLTCKLVIAVWLITGGVYALITGRLLSLPTLALFLPGIFVAALAALVSFAVYCKSVQAVDALEAGGSRSLAGVVGVFGLVWWFGATLILPAYIAVVYVRLVAGVAADF